MYGLLECGFIALDADRLTLPDLVVFLLAGELHKLGGVVALCGSFYCRYLYSWVIRPFASCGDLWILVVVFSPQGDRATMI